MPLVSSYSVVFYGSPKGYQTDRAQIQLSDAMGKTLAWVRFLSLIHISEPTRPY